MRYKKPAGRPTAGAPEVVHSAQAPCPWPTKPSKAMVAAVVTALGLLGVRVTDGTAQVLVMVLQLALVVFGVWRTWNHPKSPPGPDQGIGRYLP